MITNTDEHIDEPRINQVVFFKPWQSKNDRRKKPYPVIIKSGQFYSNGRLSNFWDWQRVTPTGRINPNVEHGYGNFTVASGYEVIRKIVVI